MKWKIEYFSEIDSTQKYLLKRVEKEDLNYYCIWSDFQTDGIGTKGREWKGKRGNLFFSFVVNLEEFNFIPLQSLSVYFSYLMYEVLKRYDDRVTLKWANDLYILDEVPKKVGGVLVNIKRKKIICGIGVNTKFNPLIDGEYKSGCLDIKIKNDKILDKFLKEVNKKRTWEEIFCNYKEIFYQNSAIFNLNYELNNDATLKAINGRNYHRG